MLNKNGGVNPSSPEELDRAKKVDLITLPRKVSGTNCFNCKFIKQLDRKDIGFCGHPEVKQLVNSRNCCAKWDAEGTFRPFKTENK